MHDNHALIESRLQRVLAQRLVPAIHTPIAPLTLSAWHVDGGAGEPVDPAVALPGGTGADYRPFAVGDAWGPAWGTSWIHATGTVPAEAAGRTVELVIDLGWDGKYPGFQAEGLAYTPDGRVIKALNPLNSWLPVSRSAAGGEAVDLYIEAAANPLLLGDIPFAPTPLGEKATAGPQPLYRVARADISIFNTDVWELVQDLQVLGELQSELDLGEPRRWDILYAIERALDAVDLADVPGTAAAGREKLTTVLARPANASAHQITAVGHAHIDSAWLWPVRETVRKVARTCSNMVALLENHPDMHFAMSSAQQYEWLKEARPGVFAKVRDAVAGGRFIPVGGMWVESDTNMVGSEAMARQFILGQRFFRENFGITCEELWLPDSFGYSAALPQIVKLAGAKWFLTQKISWNTTNKFPHHTFNWEGIDGTRVFTHFPPVDTYNSNLSGAELAHAVRNFRDKGAANHSLAPFGWGDGGGGPTREQIAHARRTRDLEGSPRVTIGSPRDFFTAAEAEYANAPVWKGELYLELHRGTYTSQALTKQGNRRNEHLLREAELWCATAAVRGLAAYPHEDLDRLWKVLLLHQFHDILPGSSIAWVHREAAAAHERTTAELEGLISRAQQALAGAPETPTDLVFNGSPLARRGVPAFAAGVPDAPTAPATIERNATGVVVRNGQISVQFDADGVITSVLDVAADRELVPAGQGANLLQLHADAPAMWDAWDIDEYYRNTVTDIRALDSLATEVLADGTAAVTITRSFRSSRAVQTVLIAPDSPQVAIRSDIDWHEHETLLKAAFPLDVHADAARFETQFGHVSRPTHENTSWDSARFEVCAHRWVHVGEPGYGAAIVNDSTYGHDVSRHPGRGGSSFTTVRLSLLRGPRFPDPETDQGRHSFSYALVVGADVSDAVAAGYALNLPERAVAGAPVAPLVAVSSAAAVIEAVKLADDRSGDVVVRLYEPLGARARLTLSTSFPLAAAVETDLLEQEFVPDQGRGGAVTSVGGNDVALSLRPFQIVTLRLTPRA